MWTKRHHEWTSDGKAPSFLDLWEDKSPKNLSEDRYSLTGQLGNDRGYASRYGERLDGPQPETPGPREEPDQEEENYCRAELEALHGKVWDKEQFEKDFEVTHWGAALLCSGPVPA